MSQFSHWLCAMQEHIIADVTSVPSLPQIQTIRFVRCFDGPDATALWIGEGSDILSLLDRREDLAGLAFFAAGDAAGLAGRAQERKVDLAVACLDLLELYDRLSAILRRRQAWAVRLLEAAGRQHNIQDIVDTAAELACGSLFLLNAGRKVVHFSGHTCLDSPPAQEMLELGLLTASTMQSLTDDGPAGPASSLFCHAMGSRGKCWVQHVRKRGELISYMVLFTPFFWRDADACMLLQKQKMGALIVFERKTKLKESVDTGTIVDADPTAPLIGNIFFNKAPLHDGAMIMREGRVYAAGCILPLTKNDSISIELGTRHRAAIGMSENSDAVVVVVSEETGQISMAVNGILTRNYTRETLVTTLESLTLPENSGEKKKSGIFSGIRRGKKE